MRSSLLTQIAVLELVASTISSAQDSRFSPKGQQQIPVPECLTMKGLWEGGSKHSDGARSMARRYYALEDGTPHTCRLRWRQIRSAGVEMDAVQFHTAADDGAGPVFL